LNELRPRSKFQSIERPTQAGGSSKPESDEPELTNYTPRWSVSAAIVQSAQLAVAFYSVTGTGDVCLWQTDWRYKLYWS